MCVLLWSYLCLGIESQDNAVNQLFNVDYDEINNEHRSEKAFEESDSECKPDKSIILSQALANNYYDIVLTQDQEQCPEWKNSGKDEVSVVDKMN